MNLSHELQLMLLAVALYVYDSSHLLHVNEGMLLRRWRSWGARLGSDRVRWAGKDVYIGSLLAPHRPLYRLRWDFEDPAPAAAGRPLADRPELGLLAPFVWAIFAAIFVLLPVALFGQVPGLSTLAAIAAIYAWILATVAVLVIRRRRLGCTGRQTLVLAFECLVCPPLAINLVRRISLATPCDESLVVAAQRLLAGEERRQFVGQCVARLDEQIAFEDEASGRMRQLERSRARLAGAQGRAA